MGMERSVEGKGKGGAIVEEGKKRGSKCKEKVEVKIGNQGEGGGRNGKERGRRKGSGLAGLTLILGACVNERKKRE